MAGFSTQQLRLVLCGLGRMGSVVERVARAEGHAIAAKLGENAAEWPERVDADAVIDFSAPEALFPLLDWAGRNRINLVVGTTGWYDRLDEVRERVQAADIGFLYSPNFSLGMQLFFRLAGVAAGLFGRLPDYDCAIHEMHHRGKADSPSGSAQHLAKILLDRTSKKQVLADRAQGRIEPEALHVTSTRVGAVPGTHVVLFDSDADSVELVHRARGRQGFARGALRAAEWLQGKRGFFTVDDMLEDMLNGGS